MNISNSQVPKIYIINSLEILEGFKLMDSFFINSYGFFWSHI